MSEIPTKFWAQIDHQLDRIEQEKPNTFTGLREILMDPRYNEIFLDRTRGGGRHWNNHEAFFSGSGGDRTLLNALEAAGWQLVGFAARYYYAVQHPIGNEVITYIEGDVYAGNRM